MEFKKEIVVNILTTESKFLVIEGKWKVLWMWKIQPDKRNLFKLIMRIKFKEKIIVNIWQLRANFL